MNATSTLDLLEAMLAPAGVSGCEQDIADVVRQSWAPWADEVTLSPLGSVHAILQGTGLAPRPRLMVSAHMDSIGLIVSGFSGGFVRLAPAGTFDPRLLPGQPVRILARRPISGTLLGPASTEPPKQPVPVTELLLDCGLSAGDLQDRVSVGDPVCFAQSPIRLGERWVASPRLDNRVSLVAATLCLRELHAARPRWDFIAVAGVREETDGAGSLTSAFALAPAAAIILDTTFGRTPDLPTHVTFPLGSGATNAWGPVVHPAMYRRLEKTARAAGLPLTAEYLPELTQTDADHIQLTREGVPSAVLSIPILNMHSPVEVVDLGDIEQAAQLLAAFARDLDGDGQLSLDDE